MEGRARHTRSLRPGDALQLPLGTQKGNAFMLERLDVHGPPAAAQACESACKVWDTPLGCIGGRGSPRRGLRRPSSVRRQRWGGPCIVVKHARWLWPPSFSVLIHSLRKHSSEKKVLAGHTGFEFSYLFALVLVFFACFYPPGDRQSPAGFTNRQGALPLIKKVF